MLLNNYNAKLTALAFYGILRGFPTITDAAVHSQYLESKYASLPQAFRESGNISEGKVTKGAFVKEMFKQLKAYVKGKEYSYISAQFFKVLAPEEYLQHTEKVRDEFRDTLKKKCEEAKARGDAVQSKLLDSAFD